MKKISWILVFSLLLSVFFSACGNNNEDDWTALTTVTGEQALSTDPSRESEQTAPSEEETTKNTASTEVVRYSEIPSTYSPEEAVNDGCLVLQWDEGEATPHVSGLSHWDDFLATSAKGEKSTLRIVYFNSSHYWYSDLYYSLGQYSLYTKDTYSENQIGPYKYMTHIEGNDVVTGEPVDFYVFTNFAEVGSEEVLSMTHICDIEAENGVVFVVVDFTTYLK